MTNQEHNQCLEALDTINLIRHYLEMASRFEQDDGSSPDELCIEEAARQISKSQETLHTIIFDDTTDEDREKEQSLTPEQKAKREERSIKDEKFYKAFGAVRDLIFEEPDSVVKFAKAFREDPSKVKDFLGEECLETLHVED